MGLFGWFQKRSKSGILKTETTGELSSSTQCLLQKEIVNRSSLTGEAERVTTDYYALADKLAHFFTFRIGDPEVKQMEEELLAGGTGTLTTVLTYLLDCGQGKQSEGWWSNVSRLVRLIRRFPSDDHVKILTRLIKFESDIYEYQTQVKNVAEEELKELKTVSVETNHVENQSNSQQAAPQKIDRTISEEMLPIFENEETIMSYKCNAFGNIISVMKNGVLLFGKGAGRCFIHFSDICKVMLFPELEEMCALGGCLKLVTKDNPVLPIRDDHSFYVSGGLSNERVGNKGGKLIFDNCFWFNCMEPNDCAAENAAVEKIKALIETKIQSTSQKIELVEERRGNRIRITVKK